MKEKIVLVDGAHVSDTLIEMCIRNDISVYANGKIEQDIRRRNKNVKLVERKTAEEICKNAVIYSTAESMLPIILKNANQNLKFLVEIFKDKILFRKTLSRLPEYKEFFFSETCTEKPELQKNRMVVLKPAIGFFSIGVRICQSKNIGKILSKATREATKAAKTYPASVLRADKWLVEEYIDGREFATDVYFDRNGEIVVNAVYLHPFKDENDTRDLVYYSNRKIFNEQKTSIRIFLEKLADTLSLRGKIRNFPLHMEYRIKNGVLYPIEINPWRFAGFGLGDLPITWGLNQYERFFGLNKKNAEPEENMNYAFILCRNPPRMQDPKLYGVDHEMYKKFLNRKNIFVEQYTELDHCKFGVASVANCKSKSEEELLSLLDYDTSPFYIKK